MRRPAFVMLAFTRMPYQMHRVFCATPGDLEEERQAFYKVVAELNEQEAMPRGILFVSVSLVPNMTDKRAYQGPVAENIRACRYYIQVLEDSWGPPQRNFERDYALAMKCAGDTASPMQEVTVFFKKPLLPHRVEPEIQELKARLNAPEFETIPEFQEQLRRQLSVWLGTV
jgi:hypothetical protein